MITLFGILSYFFIFSNKSYKKFDGYDKRFGNETVELNKINLNFKNYKLLKFLQNNDISKIQKINLVKEYFEYNSIKTFNINSGGLYDDFDFD